MPAVGILFKQDEVFGSVEAIKTVSHLFIYSRLSYYNRCEQSTKRLHSLLNSEPLN